MSTTSTPDKAGLRARFQALRDAAAPEDRAAWSARICAHVAALCAERGYRTVGAFAPFRSEVDLRPLRAAGPELAFVFPKVVRRDPPTLAWGGPPLVAGTWGLLEPAETPYALPPVQLLLVPGLAFATDGHRLGYGRGFYDATLAGLDGSVVTLAAGFDLQRTDHLPAGPTDRPVDGLVTEAGITWFRARS